MKDYSLNKEDSNFFILSYKVNNQEIILNLASGEKYKIPYTIKNEKKILKRMKKQVKNSKKYVENLENKIERNMYIVLFQIFFATCSLTFYKPFAILTFTACSCIILINFVLIVKRSKK